VGGDRLLKSYDAAIIVRTIVGLPGRPVIAGADSYRPPTFALFTALAPG